MQILKDNNDKVFLYTYTSYCVVTLHTVGRSGSFRVRVGVKTRLLVNTFPCEVYGKS